MRRLTAAMALLLFGSTTAWSSSADAASRGELVIIGSHSASIVVRLDAPPALANPFLIDAVTKGSYAGYVISDTHGRVLLGTVLVPGVGTEPGEGVPIWFSPRPFKPGRYVVTLITDGASRVVVPLPEDAHVTVRPTRSTKVFARVLHNDVLPPSAAGSPLAYSVTPVPAGHHVLAALTQFVEATTSQAGTADECFTTMHLCEVGGDGGSFSYTSPGLGASGSSSGTSMSPADFSAGTKAVLDATDAAAQARHAGFILILG